MGTVVGTCMPEIDQHPPTNDILQLAPIRRRRYGKFQMTNWNYKYFHVQRQILINLAPNRA